MNFDRFGFLFLWDQIFFEEYIFRFFNVFSDQIFLRDLLFLGDLKFVGKLMFLRILFGGKLFLVRIILNILQIDNHEFIGLPPKFSGIFFLIFVKEGRKIWKERRKVQANLGDFLCFNHVILVLN